jgi:hypothetical protein
MTGTTTKQRGATEMESTFEATVSVKECAEIGSGRNAFGEDALQALKDALNAYGMECTVEYTNATRKSAKIKIRHSEPWEAKQARTRNAGRPRKHRDQGVTLEWLESHSVSEGMEALGNVSRRTYYRRLAEMRETA